jgi:DNA replication protein DnaC
MDKTIEEYDFTFHPHLDKKAVTELFDLTILSRHENVIFLGPPGVGKTHLAIALAIKACYHGFRVYFTTMHTLIAKLKESQAKRKAYFNSSLVIVDEVGYLPVTSQEAYLFFQFPYTKVSTSIPKTGARVSPRPEMGDIPAIARIFEICSRLMERNEVPKIWLNRSISSPPTPNTPGALNKQACSMVSAKSIAKPPA